MTFPVSALSHVQAVQPLGIKPQGAGSPGAFQDVLKSAIDDVDKFRLQADEKVGKFLAGEGEDLHDVILAGRSYNGMVITGVAERSHTRLHHPVCLDAVVPQDGAAQLEVIAQSLGPSAVTHVAADGYRFSRRWRPSLRDGGAPVSR